MCYNSRRPCDLFRLIHRKCTSNQCRYHQQNRMPHPNQHQLEFCGLHSLQSHDYGRKQNRFRRVCQHQQTKVWRLPNQGLPCTPFGREQLQMNSLECSKSLLQATSQYASRVFVVRQRLQHDSDVRADDGHRAAPYRGGISGYSAYWRSSDNDAWRWRFAYLRRPVFND